MLAFCLLLEHCIVAFMHYQGTVIVSYISEGFFMPIHIIMFFMDDWDDGDDRS